MRKNLSNKQIEKYSRQIVLKNVGTIGQKKILKSNVLVVGAGGLGCPVIDYLSRAGVGRLGIIDYDKIDPSNIHRQSIYTFKDVGKYKVNVLKRKIMDINPDVKTKIFKSKITIKNVDKMSFMKIVKESNKLIDRTRNGELNADDLEGGTYTISNVGSFGNVMGTPIIMQPQVGILAIGTIKKVPAVIETKNGDEIQIRNKLFLSHTYDHRIVDGALGGKFAQKVAENLEKFDLKSNIS